MVKPGIGDRPLRESFHVNFFDSAVNHFWSVLEVFTIHSALPISIFQILHHELRPLIDRLVILIPQIKIDLLKTVQLFTNSILLLR